MDRQVAGYPHSSGRIQYYDSERETPRRQSMQRFTLFNYLSGPWGIIRVHEQPAAVEEMDPFFPVRTHCFILKHYEDSDTYPGLPLLGP